MLDIHDRESKNVQISENGECELATLRVLRKTIWTCNLVVINYRMVQMAGSWFVEGLLSVPQADKEISGQLETEPAACHARSYFKQIRNNAFI